MKKLEGAGKKKKKKKKEERINHLYNKDKERKTYHISEMAI